MSTRNESFAAIAQEIPPRQQEILNALFMTSGLSRAELANKTGMRLSSVCARVNELIEAGRVRVVGTTWDHDTKRNVETVGL